MSGPLLELADLDGALREGRGGPQPLAAGRCPARSSA